MELEEALTVETQTTIEQLHLEALRQFVDLLTEQEVIVRLAELIADHLQQDLHLTEEAIVRQADHIVSLQQDLHLIEVTADLLHQDHLLRIAEVLLQEVARLDQAQLGHHQEDNNY